MNSSSSLILEPVYDQNPVVTDKQPAPAADAQSSIFPTTPWSQLMRLRGDDAGAQQALANVCRLYWYPVYAYIRGRGHSPHDAEDLAQGFFLEIIRREDLISVDQRDGKLRIGITMPQQAERIMVEKLDMEWTKTADIGADSILFNTFHGGSDSTWAPSRACAARFSEFSFLR